MKMAGRQDGLTGYAKQGGVVAWIVTAAEELGRRERY